jgi:hypothetical protein
MSSIMSVLQSAYSSSSSSSSLISPGDKFTKVDPTLYQGTWTGTDFQHQPVTVSITKVQGYRANVTLQTSAGLQYQQAFITTKGTFRIGDSQFSLTGTGAAKVTTIVTDPTTGNQTENTTPIKLQT